MLSGYSPIAVPFNFRHACWFCAEPSSAHFAFPQNHNVVLALKHPSLTLPCCKECLLIANQSKDRDIWAVRQSVKKGLLQQYKTHLAIGINWTKEELANSGFEGGNFEGFQKSGWAMFEIARERVNFKGWSLEVSGISIEDLKESEEQTFTFDGVYYPSIELAIDHYAKAFSLEREFFRKVVATLGNNNFSNAVRFCRLLLGTTPNERQKALSELIVERINT